MAKVRADASSLEVMTNDAGIRNGGLEEYEGYAQEYNLRCFFSRERESIVASSVSVGRREVLGTQGCLERARNITITSLLQLR